MKAVYVGKHRQWVIASPPYFFLAWPLHSEAEFELAGGEGS